LEILVDGKVDKIFKKDLILFKYLGENRVVCIKEDSLHIISDLAVSLSLKA